MSLEYLTVEHLNTKQLIRIFSQIEIHPDAAFNGTPCWIWCGYRVWDGYGRTHLNKRAERVHRIIFAWLVHPIPRKGNGGELDHLCDRPSCCNPLHLQFVPHYINQGRNNSVCSKNARKTHCKNGHPFTAENLIADPYGRRCKTCVRERQRVYTAAHPEKQKAASRKYLEQLGVEERRRRERERYHANIELSRAKLKAKRLKRRLANV